MIKGHPKEGESVINRGILFETNVCVKSYVPNHPIPILFLDFMLQKNVLAYFHILIHTLLKIEYPPNFPLYIKFWTNSSENPISPKSTS